MIAKVTATGAAVTPVAAAALGKSKALATEPVIWHFLGYSFEAAGTVAALFGCLVARYWVGSALALKQQHRWSLDVPVSAMALATSAGLMMSTRPAPLYALLVGAGVRIIGRGHLQSRRAAGASVEGVRTHRATASRSTSLEKLARMFVSSGRGERA